MSNYDYEGPDNSNYEGNPDGNYEGNPDCEDCDGDGWVCEGGKGCTLEDNLAGTEPDHLTPCPNAVACGCDPGCDEDEDEENE